MEGHLLFAYGRDVTAEQEQAVLLLETGTEPLDAIAARLGYADATMLRRLLHKQVGIVAAGGDPAGVFFDPDAPPVKFSAGNFLET